jgi:PAS domain S-box-containing protein
MMTGEGSENIAVRAIQSGAMDYLVKGDYSFAALLPLIEKAVRLREMQRAMEQSLKQIGYQALLLDNMRDAVVVWGLDGAITYWNAAAEQLYGAPAASRLGQPVAQVYFPCFDPPLSQEAIARAGSLQVEQRIVAPAACPEPGRSPAHPAPRWISAHVTTLYNQASPAEPVGYMNVSRDITPIKRAEVRLQRRLDSEKLISTVSGEFVNLPLSGIEQGVLSALERITRFIHVDQAILHLWQADHLVPYLAFPGEAASQAPDPNDAPWLLEKLRRQETVVINRLADLPPAAKADRDALKRAGLCSLIAIPLARSGQVFGLITFGACGPKRRWPAEDIDVLKTVSELIASALVRKQMAEQIQDAQARLAQAARLASIGELASGVAHTISNPLTTIIAEAQILAQQLGPTHPGRESAEAIVAAGWRAQQVINELMKFSQPGEAEREPVSVNQTIQQALLLASAQLQAASVRLDVALAPDLPPVIANPRQLTDIWVNLLLLSRNAFSQGEAHHLRIATARAPSGQELWVDFTGDGRPIPPEEYDTIFEPRMIPPGAGRGTGMELSLCRELARQNRGRISLSGNGHETTFHITFSTEGQ